MSIETLYDQEMDVLQNAFVRDTMGGVVNTPSVKSTANPCHIRKLSGSERPIVGREGVVSTHRIYCGPDVDIVEQDTAVILEVEYDVLLVDDPHLLGHHLEIDVILRRLGN